MATKPEEISTSDEKKDGIRRWLITALAATTPSDPIDVTGAKAVYAVGAGALTFRLYDENDGSTYQINSGSDVVNGTTAGVGHINNPPPKICVQCASGPNNVVIQAVFGRRGANRNR